MTISTSDSRRRVALAVLLIAALLVGFVADASTAGAATARRGTVLRLTNQDREAKDRRALDLDTQLSRYAKKHSREMAQAGQIFHTEDLAAKLRGRDWSMGGENVGMGSSLTTLQNAFMGSKPHRKNILQKRFDHVAIGVVRSDGNFWVTVIFYG